MNTTMLLLNEAGRWLVTQLGRMSVELAILAGIVLVALYVLRVKSPALRHLFWGLLLAKPVLTFLVASPLSLYAFLWPPTPEVFFTPPPAVVQTVQAPLPLPATPLPNLAPSAAVPRVEAPPFWRQVDRYGLAMLAWALVASLLGLRLLLGCAYVAFLRTTARTRRDGVLAELVAEAAATLRVRRRVAIATTTVCHGPVLAGIFRPVILLPETMATALTEAQLRLVITHELAHARRWDNLVLLIQRLAEMLFFFHPVVWLCGWMMRREAEAACDDMVVNAYGDVDGTGAAAYADSLTRVAEMKCGITRRLLVNTFAAAESNFHRRIRRILSGKRTRMTLWLSLATGAALVLIGVLGLPAASAPRDKGKPDNAKNSAAPEKSAAADAEMPGLQPLSGEEGAKRVGIYDAQAVLRDFKDREEAYEGLQAEVSTLQKEVDQKSQAAKEEKEKFDKEKSNLSEQEAAARKKHIDALYQEYQDALKANQQNIDEKEKALIAPFVREIQEAAKRAADELGCSEAKPQTQLSGKDGTATVDLTRRIRQLLGAKLTNRPSLLSIQEGPEGPTAEIETALTGATHWYKAGDKFEEFSVMEISKEAGTVRLGVEGGKKDILLKVHPRTAQEGAYATPEGNYTHLVTFEPAGDFHPSTPRELLDVFNGVCKARTGYFRTKPQDGKLIGRICTDKPEEIQKSFEKEPRLRFVESVPLTPELFAQHEASKQESLSGGSTAQKGTPGFTAGLRNGRAVALVSIRRHAPGDTAFWRPDGTPIGEAPYDPALVADCAEAQGRAYEFAFRIMGMKRGEPVRWQFDASPGWALADLAGTDGALSVATVFLDPDATTSSMKLLVASGDWHPLLEYQPGGKADHAGEEHSVVVGEPYEEEGDTCVTLRLDGGLAEKAVRLVAGDREGSLYPAESQPMPIGKLYQQTYRFSGLKRKDFKGFVLYTCPWREVRFTNISLVPGKRAEQLSTHGLSAPEAVPQPGVTAASAENGHAEAPVTSDGASGQPVAVQTGIRKDFEHCAGGVNTWPEGWIADGNASNHEVCYVDGTTFKDTHGNTLRLQGDTPAWSPLAHLLTNVAPPFRVAFDVYLEGQGSETTCVVGVRSEPSWKAPGVILFDTIPPGEVKGLEPVAGGGVMSKGQATSQLHMELARWYHVELTLQEEQGRQTLAITLNDGTGAQGPVQLSTDTTLVKDMPYLQLEVRSGTAWFDNVSMEPLETTQAVSHKVESGNYLNGTGVQPSVEETVAQGNPDVGPLVVAPLIGFLDDKVKAEWQAQGVTGGMAQLGKLQDETMQTLRARLDRAGLQEVNLEKRINGRVAVQIPPAMDAARVGVLVTQPGVARFLPAASRDETMQVLQEIEKNPSFQGRLTGLLDPKSKDHFPTVPTDKHAAAEAVVGEINDARPRLLPEGKMFFLGSKSSPNTLYLIDKNSPMANVKVKSASAAPDTDNPGKAKINFSFSDEDAQRFGDLTQSLVGKGLAILVNWEVQSVPIVRDRITKSGQMAGNYTLEEATDIAARISVPEYPAQLLVLSDPTATPRNPEPAKVNDVSKALETRYYSGIDEGLWNRLLCKFLVPVFDPATGEELSFAKYDKAKDELSVRNLPDNLAAFEVMLTHFEAGHLQTESAQKKEDANEPHVSMKHSSNVTFTAGKMEGNLEKGRLTLSDNPTISAPGVPELRGEEVVIDTKDNTVEVKKVRVKEAQLAAETETAPTAWFDNVSMVPLQPAPPENKDITAAASNEDKTALAEFRLYAAHGAVTQNGKPLPNLQDTMDSPFKEAKASPLMLHGLLTSAKEGDGFAVGGAPFVMDGRTLTWAGRDTPDPDCAMLLASTTFPIVSDERISQNISIPKESEASGSFQRDAVIAVVCQLVKPTQTRLWITPERLDESGANAASFTQNPWMNIVGAAPQDTWQLMVLDMSDDKNVAQRSLLLFWRLKYGSVPEPGEDRPQVKTGKVVFGEDAARVADNTPQYTAELRLLAGTRALVESFCAQLDPAQGIAHGPEVEQAFSTNNAAGVEAFFKTNDDTPDLELLSAPRATFKLSEDPPAIPPDPWKRSYKLVTRTRFQASEKINVPEIIDRYSASFREFCEGSLPAAIVMDASDFVRAGNEDKAMPISAGVVMALNLSKTDAPDQFSLDLYVNNKEVHQASRGLAFWKPVPQPEIFESPIVLHLDKDHAYTMGDWVIAVTKHRDPEKATLAVLRVEPAPPRGARSFETTS